MAQAMVIDVDFTESDRKVEAAGILHALLSASNRKIRRLLLRVSKRVSMMWFALPSGLRAALLYGIAFLGWFIAWMFFYCTLILAWAYSIPLGMAVTVLWGMVIGYIIYQADPH